MNMNRTNYLGELNIDNEGQKVRVMGWIKNHRNFGEIVFIDLKDMTGFSQIVFDDKLIDEVKNLSFESTIIVDGIVKKRQDINKKIKTGEIEVIASSIEVINRAQVIPVDLSEDSTTSEDTLLKYRFLDLRREKMQKNLILRHKVSKSIRNYLDQNRFLEVETPILTKSTPEGARDYLVPSRVSEHKFYALPQSPQIYKNLLMNASIDRYYQFAKCFRDEDLRSDRQPEFTQIDLEMCFMNENEIRDLMEEMIKSVMEDVMNVSYDDKFQVMNYNDAMNKYGVDKPDTRFEMFIYDLTKNFENTDFNVFKSAQFVKAINLKNCATDFSRKDITLLETYAKKYDAKSLPWLKYTNGEFSGSIIKVLSIDELNGIKDELKVEENDLILFSADSYDIVSAVLGNLRNHIAEKLNLIDKTKFNFLWIVEWPMFEFDEELNRYFAMHHPFTMPEGHRFNEDFSSQKALAYDLVLNGHEIGGGSIRINNPELQSKMFEILGFTAEEIENQFGFLVDAYKYGAPYHGGIAFGLDRLVMCLLNTNSIRDVIAFAKNNRASDVMMDAPSFISEEQIKDLHIKLND